MGAASGAVKQGHQLDSGCYCQEARGLSGRTSLSANPGSVLKFNISFFQGPRA